MEFAECIGVCEGAPAVLINDEGRPNVTPDKVDALMEELRHALADDGGLAMQLEDYFEFEKFDRVRPAERIRIKGTSHRH